MAKLSQAQTKKLAAAVVQAFTAFAAIDADAEAQVNNACEAITKLIAANAIASNIKPKKLGQLFFGDEYKGDKSKPTPQLNFIRRVVERLRANGVLVTAPRQKPAKAVTLPTLEALKALAHLEPAAAAAFADEVLFDLTELEIEALIATLSACVA